MTAKQNAQLEWDQQTAGLQYGANIAQLIITKYPDGFDTETGDAITSIVDDAVKTVIDTMEGMGVQPGLRETFESAYYIAVRNAFSEYAGDCKVRACKEAA